MTVQEPTTPSELFSPFLPTTQNIPEEEDTFKNFLNDKFSGFADVINDKKIGTISQASENFNGETWFYKVVGLTRNGFSTLAYIPSLPNTSTLTLTLSSTPKFPIVDIDPNFVITLSYGTASKPPTATGAGNGDFFTYMNKGDSRISWTMSDLSITITTTTNLSAYSGFIVISYLRRGL
jgi:hypothetical protein